MWQGAYKRKPDEKPTHYRETYIALLDVNFGWEPEHVEVARGMWNSGAGIERISYILERDPDEVFLMLLDLARKRKIKSRTGGLFGEAIQRAKEG